jgi:hypothetical protein
MENIRLNNMVKEHITNNRFSILALSQQLGIYRTFADYILSYVSTNAEKTILIASPKSSQIHEFYGMIDNILPSEFIVHRSKNTIKLTNGCVIKFLIINKNITVSLTLDLVLVLDMANCRNGEMNTFYRDIIPHTSSRSNTKIILASHMSTNEKCLFYSIFKKSEYPEGHVDKTIFAPLRVYYWYRDNIDNTWVTERISEHGADVFNMYFNLSCI